MKKTLTFTILKCFGRAQVFMINFLITNSSHLKTNGWMDDISFWDGAFATVDGRNLGITSWDVKRPMVNSGMNYQPQASTGKRRISVAINSVPWNIRGIRFEPRPLGNLKTYPKSNKNTATTIGNIDVYIYTYILYRYSTYSCECYYESCYILVLNSDNNYLGVSPTLTGKW